MVKTKIALKYSLISAGIFFITEFLISKIPNANLYLGQTVLSSFIVFLIAFIGMQWSKK